MTRVFAVSLLIAAAAACGAAEGRAATEAGQAVDYTQDARPIFLRRCARCHGAVKHEAGLRLDAGQMIRKGSDDGPVVVSGKPAQSKLIARITASDESRMPPEGDRLSSIDVATLRRWIEQGARFPAAERIPEDPARHWAFLPPRAAAPPRVDGADPANAIDTWIALELTKRGCSPVGPAPREVLLRRVSLDLTGLPPSVDELRDFVGDPSSDAYSRAVDRLLASPAYAERWARHWMDIWRYSDWYGFGGELRNSARSIWRWRDWIVESLNADKPYNEMVMEMLAADELSPTDADSLRATGFLARDYFLFNRNAWLDTTVEHTAKAFLGITLNCARCHDHVYDPIEQADYYRFRAIFEPYQVRLDRVGGSRDPVADGLARVFDANLAAPTYLFARGNEKMPDKEHPLRPGVPAALHGPRWDVGPVALPPPAYHPGLLSSYRADEMAAADAACRAIERRLARSRRRSEAFARRPTAGTAANSTRESPEIGRQREVDRIELASAKAARDSLEARIAAEQAAFAVPPAANAPALAAAAARAERQAAVWAAKAGVAQAELGRQFVATGENRRRRNRARRAGTPETRLASARKALAQSLKNAEQATSQFTPLGPTYPSTSSGRRLALARWIASDKNPLTARVAVNDIWLRHFGSPLVPTVFDFGLNGKPPTHPELLDWLAVDFMRSGWSMKRLHRLIVLSRAYQRDSLKDPLRTASARVDPDNRLLWRMNARRLESEAVRDSVLAVSGRLDRRVGGPEIDSILGETTYRRSIYYRHAPEKFMTFLQTFDAPSTNECYRRNETVVPQQALALANSTLAIDQARWLAGLLSRAVGENASADRPFVQALFERVLGRRPSEDEWSSCREFLLRQSALLAGPKRLTKFDVGRPSRVKGSPQPHQRAREDLAHVLLNHNEFITVR